MNDIATSPASSSAQDIETTAWHALSAQAVLEQLSAAAEGLSSAEARARLERFGPNRLPPPARRGALARFMAQFQNPLIHVLLGAAAVAVLLGEWENALVILGVAVINAAVGFIQEGKAEAALDAIRSMLSPHATVVRDGERTTVPAGEVVPGDVVFLQSGDRVPADIRLLGVNSLQCEEAALTGESVPVDKTVAPVAADASLGDRRCMAYSGTLVAYGQATGVVAATGISTELGRIERLLKGVTNLSTPLMRQLDQFARRLTIIVLALAVAICAFGILVWRFPVAEMFMAGVGIAVAAIPEGLPAIMTIALAVGVQRMARRKAIVRHLPSVETLGSVTVICTDKTGTLTSNEMTIQTIVTAEGTFTVTGVGYAPEGAVLKDGEPAVGEARDTLIELARAGLLCNEASLARNDDGWRVTGDPTEGALLTLAMKLSLDPAAEATAHPRTATIPFESERQYMASLNRFGDEGQVLVKGAVERVLPRCSSVQHGGRTIPIELTAWENKTERLAADGKRVLAVAVKPVSKDGPLEEASIAEGLVLLGLVGLIDPPRPEAVTAIARCREAGITTKMITGDHAVTARAIAREIGLTDSDEVITGQELATIADADLPEHAARTHVFARVAPEQKLRLVEALQSRGEIVAMTGDGVNDAPALKRADIGVAMGARGTEAAKEAARMVLADDNFATLTAAVEEGRTIYDNLRKGIAFTLATSCAQALTIIVAITIGEQLPLTTLQILWVNMVTAVTLALALGVEPSEPDVMQRPPRDTREPLISGALARHIVIAVLVISGLTIAVFVAATELELSISSARTLALNVLVGMEISLLLSVRNLTGKEPRRPLSRMRPLLLACLTVVLLQLALTYLPVLQRIFDTTPVSLIHWGIIVGLAIVAFLLFELAERLLRRSPQ
jgi:magnesium-transporting ATPase (P-type)